jgi:carbamoyltransferase
LIKDAINQLIDKKKFKISFFNNAESLSEKIASIIIEKKIVGLFSGRMEFGSRALGNRSIIADPRDSVIRDIINSKTKKRENFRPFAPAILYEEVNKWFDINHEVNFMSEVYNFKKEKKIFVPAVCHVDNTGRLQTVSKESNKIFYSIIKKFYNLTNIPIILNTSFNENEPIVCSPSDAIQTFLKTKIDALILEDWLIER